MILELVLVTLVGLLSGFAAGVIDIASKVIDYFFSFFALEAFLFSMFFSVAIGLKIRILPRTFLPQ